MARNQLSDGGLGKIVLEDNMLFTESHIDRLTFDAHALISRVVSEHHPFTWAPMLSGGHDSMCACHVVSTHPLRPKPFVVHHIDTGTGAKYTRDLVERLCVAQGWELKVHKSEDDYGGIVAAKGMPGPGMHQWVYVRLKERCIQTISVDGAKGQRPTMLLSGVRKHESVRRFGHSVEVRRGDGYMDGGCLRNPSRLWVAPCFQWSTADQSAYMEEFGLPINKLKTAIGISGECFCGCFAQPGERERIAEYAPDVDENLMAYEADAKRLGLPCVWGQSRPVDSQDMPLFAMDLCSGCLQRQ